MCIFFLAWLRWQIFHNQVYKVHDVVAAHILVILFCLNEWIYASIHKVYTPHTRYQKKGLRVANMPKNKFISVPPIQSIRRQNRDFNCSIIDPTKSKLETEWRSGKQQFIHFTTFLSIISSWYFNKILDSIHKQGWISSGIDMVDSRQLREDWLSPNSLDDYNNTAAITYPLTFAQNTKLPSAGI